MIKLPTVVTKFGAKAGVWLTKHGPTIMSVGGGAMAIGGAVLACKATLHADEVIAHHQEKMRKITLAKEISDNKVENGEVDYGDEVYSEKQMKKDKAIAYLETGVEFAKLYAPAVGLGLGGVGLMQGAFAIMKGRHGQAIAALGALDKAYTSLLAQRDEMGLPAVPDTIPAEPIDILEEGEEANKPSQVVVDADAVDDPFFFIFDARNPNWCGGSGFLLNERFLTAGIDGFNYRLQGKTKDYYWVNDLLKVWDMDETDLGHFHGWNGATGDVIEYELVPYLYGDDLVLHPTTMDALRDMELQDIQDGYCIGIRLLSSSDGYNDVTAPRMIYNEVYGK